ncbi:hypothetical protein [Salmonella enterica]|uniref:hypothetical protein n=1 Tax=Salmonella enterica TaxID=28901 RepID=UPI000DEC6633|nr:hypothetical protein [Salmonella enterica]AXD10701.1 hypothetical protein CHE29_18385 [Salmonella enterica]
MRKAKKGWLIELSLGGMYADGDYVIPDYKLAIKMAGKKQVKQGSYFPVRYWYHYNYSKNFPRIIKEALIIIT